MSRIIGIIKQETIDDICDLVLVQVDDSHMPYICYLYNKQTKGYAWGRYRATMEAGLEKYEKRAKLYGLRV